MSVTVGQPAAKKRTYQCPNCNRSWPVAMKRDHDGTLSPIERDMTICQSCYEEGDRIEQ